MNHALEEWKRTFNYTESDLSKKNMRKPFEDEIIVVYRNYKRNRMLNASHSSVKYFLPNAKFYCWTFYDRHPDEYKSQPLLNPEITNFMIQTKYPAKDDRPHDNVWNTDPAFQTHGYANSDNVKWFAEGYNLMHDYFKDVDNKVLLLAEESYFTTGGLIEEIIVNDYDVAFSPWDHPAKLDTNNYICIRPARMKHCFPFPEWALPGKIVEWHLGEHMVAPIRSDRRYIIQHRKQLNFGGDGSYTNSSLKIEQDLRAVGIIK